MTLSHWHNIILIRQIPSGFNLNHVDSPMSHKAMANNRPNRQLRSCPRSFLSPRTNTLQDIIRTLLPESSGPLQSFSSLTPSSAMTRPNRCGRQIDFPDPRCLGLMYVVYVVHHMQIADERRGNTRMGPRIYGRVSSNGDLRGGSLSMMISTTGYN